MSRQGFWVKTSSGGSAHVLGDPNMSAESLAAVHAVIDAALKLEIPQNLWTLEGKANPSDTEWVSLGCGEERVVGFQYMQLVFSCPGGAYRLLNSQGVVVATTEKSADLESDRASP